MQNLMLKASEAIASLWLKQLETISATTGVEMDILCNCLNLQVPEQVPEQEQVVVPVANEKKKRAPAKKKATPVVEEVPDEAQTPLVTEKKKRAPAKKKATPVVATVALKEGSHDDESCSGNTVLMQQSSKATKKVSKKAKKENDCEVSPTTMKINEDVAKAEKESSEKATKKATKKASKKALKEGSRKERIDVEEVMLGATSFLVADNNVAYLKSSRQEVGIYDPAQNDIHTHTLDDDSADESADECPVLSDMSDEE